MQNNCHHCFWRDKSDDTQFACCHPKSFVEKMNFYTGRYEARPRDPEPIKIARTCPVWCPLPPDNADGDQFGPY